MPTERGWLWRLLVIDGGDLSGERKRELKRACAFSHTPFDRVRAIKNARVNEPTGVKREVDA